jgi:hexosaminidase
MLSVRLLLAVFTSTLLFTTSATLQADTQLSIMPLPARATPGAGSFIVDGTFQVRIEGYTEPRLERAKDRFLATLTNKTGIPLWLNDRPGGPKFIIKTE